MRLEIGERLSSAGRTTASGAYVVTALVCETPWFGLYLGKKIFANFDFVSKRPRQAGPAEWLEVYLRTIHYLDPEDVDYVLGRRALARAEVHCVLSGRSNVWPEPVDLLEVVNTHDAFVATGSTSWLEAAEPIVVFARPGGEPLPAWRRRRPSLAARQQVLAELFDFVARNHRDGLLLQTLDPQAVLVDDAGHIHYLGSDRALPADQAHLYASERFFPAERFPVAFAAPECFVPGVCRDARSDLYSWAALACWLLCDAEVADLFAEVGGLWFPRPGLSLVEAALRTWPAPAVQTWAERLRLKQPESFVARWPASFLAGLQWCLAALPDQRPESVAACRQAWCTAPPTTVVRAQPLAGSAPAPPEQLWDRLLYAADYSAARQLLDLFGVGDQPQETTDAAYLTALSDRLRRWLAELPAAQHFLLAGLIPCLRQDSRAHRFFPALLADPDPAVRELARQLLLPELRLRLAGPDVQAAEVRQELERLGPAVPLEEKILLCRQLLYHGLAVSAVRQCLAQLRAEQPTPCPECQALLPAGQLEEHLRRLHHLYQFRGVRRPRSETLAFLLQIVVSPRPDVEAWNALQAIVREEHGPQAEALLASWLAQKLYLLPQVEQELAAHALAEILAEGDWGRALLPLLAHLPETSRARSAGGLLALALAVRLPPPLPHDLVQAVLPWLGAGLLPLALQVEATAALLASTGAEGAAAQTLLQAYLAGVRSQRALRRLQALEGRLGPLPILETITQEIEESLPLRCPRCAVELPRPLLAEHLWNEHRLVLEGRRAREPWRLIQDWLEDYRLERDPEVLRRCRELACRLDAEQGLLRLARLAWQRGLEEPDMLAALLAEAERRQACLCPYCYAFVALPATEEPVPDLVLGPGMLSSGDYTLRAVDVARLLPWLTITTPAGVLYDGLQPQWRATWAGLALRLAVLWLLLFLVVLFTAGLPLPGFLGVMALAAVLLVLLGIRFWPTPPSLEERTLEAAWLLLAPSLVDEGNRSAAAFLAGLARASLAFGLPRRRSRLLAAASRWLEERTQADPAWARYLGAVRRLAVEEEARAGGDLAALLAEQAARSLAGELPLAFADQLLTDLPTGRRQAAFRARLRALLCRRAFALGLECSDLVDLAAFYPALGQALQTADDSALAQLRTLVWLEQARPWNRLGEVRTLFEIAEDRQKNSWLEECPDLLLAGDGVPPLRLGTHGVWFQGEWLSSWPVDLESKPRAEGGWWVRVGAQRFLVRQQADEVLRRLERWLRYYHLDFLPQAQAARRWRRPGSLAVLAGTSGCSCTACRCRLLPRSGALGLLLAEPPTSQPMPAA
jgi:hypothetical protein